MKTHTATVAFLSFIACAAGYVCLDINQIAIAEEETAMVPGQYFGVIAARSASPIHLQPIAASGERLWIGKDTASYCPPQVGKNCPPGTNTNFGGGEGTLGMGAIVPGGQV